MKNQRTVFLTFDVEGPPFQEDLINHKSLDSLLSILQLLDKCDLRGLFFITGSVAEKIGCYPKILKLLEKHEIGYHSTTHSV